MSEIVAKVTDIIVDKLGVNADEVKPEASFTNDLGADSLDTVELIMEFGRQSRGNPHRRRCHRLHREQLEIITGSNAYGL